MSSGEDAARDGEMKNPARNRPDREEGRVVLAGGRECEAKVDDVFGLDRGRRRIGRAGQRE